MISTAVQPFLLGVLQQKSIKKAADLVESGIDVRPASMMYSQDHGWRLITYVIDVTIVHPGGIPHCSPRWNTSLSKSVFTG